MTNCLLVAVTATNPFTWQGSSRITSTTGIFQTAGAGQYYLANGSPYRNSGVSGINATLQTQLRKTTTYPPVTLSGTVTVPTTLHPTVQRETDALDVGYHYAVLDHVISTLAVTNTTLTLANGVALGFHGPIGIWLQPKSSLTGRGLPHQLNVLVRSGAVQESTNSPSPSSGDTLLYAYSGAGVFADAPSVDLRFTAFIANSPGGYHLYHVGNYQVYSARIQHSQFAGGWFYVETGAETPAITLNNNVHWRTQYWLEGTLGLSMRHQLNQNGYYDFWATSPSNTWEIIENVFDKTPATRTGQVITNFKNAFVGGGSALTATTGTNVFLTTFTYASGALGGWYHGQTNLADNGSRSASAAGLYHFTTTTNQSKETNSLVDIGFHLTAVDGSGLPLDTDGDGIPDYVEDADGDGTVSGSESDWLAAPGVAGGLKLQTPTAN